MKFGAYSNYTGVTTRQYIISRMYNNTMYPFLNIKVLFGIGYMKAKHLVNCAHSPGLSEDYISFENTPTAHLSIKWV